MAGLVSAELSHHGASDGNSCKTSKDKPEEALGRWYLFRKEIEENSPSRKDGIDLKKETYLRKSYCTFLQDLGMRLKVPQVTIATAIIFCHRFFLRQSHAKNDRRTIATVCMFLAGKVEETPRPLKDVILISYEMIHKKDPAAAQRIKQKGIPPKYLLWQTPSILVIMCARIHGRLGLNIKIADNVFLARKLRNSSKEVYEQQKELILVGERVVLATLAFDLNVQHPYKPLVEAIKKFNVAKNALAQVAWNFVNDGLRTSLCLQFKPHHIAAGAIFLAAKFLKVRLPSDGEKVWWQEFDVTPRQLEEVSNQMLELYEQNRIPQTQGSEAEGAAGGGTRASTKAPSTNEEQTSKPLSSHPAPPHSNAENNTVQLRGVENQSNDGSAEMGSDITDHKMDLETRDSQNSEKSPQKDNAKEVENISKSGTERIVAGEQDRVVGRNLELREGPVGQSPNEAMKMLDKDKLKAALEKRRKERSEMKIKKDVMDEDDLIERELEDGVELAVENEKNKQERRYDEDHGKEHEETRDGRQMGTKGKLQKETGEYNAEEGEMIDDASSLLNNRKRKMGSPPAAARQPEMKKRHDSSYHDDLAE